MKTRIVKVPQKDPEKYKGISDIVMYTNDNYEVKIIYWMVDMFMEQDIAFPSIELAESYLIEASDKTILDFANSSL